MKIYMATWLMEKSQGIALTKKNSSKRLLSYHFLVEQGISTEQINQYCRTGRLDPRKTKEK